MEDTGKTALFEEMPVHKAVMTLSIPTVLSSLVMVIYNLADTYFVGMLNDPVQNAAVTLAAPVLLAFNAVNNLFGVGTSSMMSRALGSKDYGLVRRSSAFGFYCTLIAGVLFSLFFTILHNPLLHLLGADAETMEATAQYLKWTVSFGAVPAILNVVMAYMVRAEGASLHASIGTMSGCLLNILLDPFFVLPMGLNMGAAGAGLATMLSNCVACTYFFFLLWKKREDTYVCVRPSMFRPDRQVVTGVCWVGIPAAIQNLLNVTGMTVLNNFTASYGSDAVAAMGIVQKVNMVPMPLISYNFASGNVKRMKKTLLFTVKIAVSFLMVVAVGYYVGAGSITALFMRNEAIISYGERFLRAFCLELPFMCMDFIAVGVFQSCGMGEKSLVFALLRKIVLEIPALYLLNRLFPLYGLPFAQPVTECILCVAAVLVLFRMFKKMEQKRSS